ncbi:MAG: ChbG/HpnK family deacetylase [Bacteroidota bacterium]
MTGLIVTADDLGLRPDVDLGIVDAHRAGAVTHASWLAGGASSREAVALVEREAPEMGIGLHLSLSQTQPSGDPARLGALLEAGRFPERQFEAIRWAWISRDHRRAIADEWEAQAVAFREAWGRVPYHLDSHQHVHLAPGLHALAVRLAIRHGIPRIRAPRGGSPGRGPRGTLDAAVLSALGRRLAKRATEAGLVVPDVFDGFHVSGALTREDLRAMRTRTRGLTEWMVHPGRTDEPGGYARRQELEALRRWAASE